MRTREESLNNFCEVLDRLINSKYLFAGADIFNVIKTINSSKLLNDTFEYFTSGFDFEYSLTNALVDDGDEKFFVLPSNPSDIIALVYLLLKEINYKHAQLTDFLDYFDGGKNYEIAYSNFANQVLLPFKNCVYQVGLQIINSTISQNEIKASKSLINEEPISVNFEETVLEKEEEFKGEKDIDGYDNITLLRLVDLDNLAITQSKINTEEKKELLYVLNVFAECIRENDDDKIKLSYLAYYYAIRGYKKLKNNLKDITKILIERKII